MISNDKAKSKPSPVNSSQKRPSTPPCKSLRSEFLSASKVSDTKPVYSASKHSVDRTPTRPKHRKTRSVQDPDNSPQQFSTFAKSRLDIEAIPAPYIDLKSCLADIARYKSQQKRDSLAEKKIMMGEWNKAKQNYKIQTEKEAQKHEEMMTLEKLDMKKIMQEKEKERKNLEREEKMADFFAVKEAKRNLQEAEKRKELEKLSIEREKSINKQKELERKREKLKNEREEKRKCFLESIAAMKQAQEEDSLRLKKELEYEHAQELLGLREIAYQKSLLQRSCLEKTGSILL